VDAGSGGRPPDEIDEAEIAGRERILEVLGDGLRRAASRKDELAEGKDDDGERDEWRLQGHASGSLRSPP
jgi:hypothetical protein